MNAQQIINQTYSDLETKILPNADRAQLYYTIVCIKQSENISDIYLDIKHFIKNYVIALDEQRYNYDKIDAQKIMHLVNLLVIEQKVAILDFLRKMFIRHQCDDDWKIFEPDYYKLKVDALMSKWHDWINPISLFRFLYFKLCYSNAALFTALSCFLLLDMVIMLPNPWDIWPSFYKIEYHQISDSFYVNHVMNIVMALFEFDIDFKVLPLNLLALVALLFGKGIKILVVVGYIIDKVIKRVNFND